LAVAKAEVEAAQADSDMAKGQIAVMQGGWEAAEARLEKARNGPTAIDIKMAEGQVDAAVAQLYVIELMKDVARGYLKGMAGSLQSQIDIAKLQLEGVLEGTGQEDLAAAQAGSTQAWSDLQAARAQFSQAEAQVSATQAAVRTAEAQVAQANAEVETARAQVQQAQAALETMMAGSRQEDIKVAEAAVAEATSYLTAARNALEEATLTALFDGTVGAVLVDEGQLVQPAEVVIMLGDLSLLRAETEDLSEVDVSRIQVGQRAAVTVDALGGRVLPGTVARVAPVATERRGARVYLVSLDLDAASSPSLRWGMSAFVEIDTASEPDGQAGAQTRASKSGP
jgi:hypothetical protein